MVRLTARFWTLLCTGPLLGLVAYQLWKKRGGWLFAGNLSQPESVHVDAVLLLIAVLGGTLAIVRWHHVLGRLLPLVAGLVATLMSVAVLLQMDRRLEWGGMDVPPMNYEAALLALDIGPGELLATWNARANPRVEPNYMPHPREVLKRIERLRLGWIVGTRWDRLDLPQGNNRMHMHPPGYPLALAAWLSMVGSNRLAAATFELLIKFLLVFAAVAWALSVIPAEDSLPRVAVALLLATAPPLGLAYFPHANELGALLGLGGLALACKSTAARSWWTHAVAGVLLGMATYTNFMFVIVLLAVVVAVALSGTVRGTLWPMLVGAGLVVIAFTSFGYYPWLTYFTGVQVTTYYRDGYAADLASCFVDFVYVGVPLLLVLGLAVLELAKLDRRVLPWMAAALTALALGAQQSFGLIGGHRYLIGMVFLVVPLVAATVRSLRLTLHQVTLIPIANLGFLGLTVFL